MDYNFINIAKVCSLKKSYKTLTLKILNNMMCAEVRKEVGFLYAAVGEKGS